MAAGDGAGDCADIVAPYRAMFMGALLGDALGAPHEFKHLKHNVYTGQLQYSTYLVNRWTRERRELKVGQVTDDSEMAIILLRSILQHGGYSPEHVLLEYMEWAQNAPFMGNNTRNLFKDAGARVDKLGAYRRRLAVAQTEAPSHSNGALMRCWPLVLLQSAEAVLADVNATNPYDVPRECNLVYINMLSWALQGCTAEEILVGIRPSLQCAEIVALYTEENRNICTNKGHCLHALWCCFTVLRYWAAFEGQYSKIMHWVIAEHIGSDTDTNAAIVGALVGALLGWDAMVADQRANMELLLAVDFSAEPSARPLKCQPHDFEELCVAMAAMSQVPRE